MIVCLVGTSILCGENQSTLSTVTDGESSMVCRLNKRNDSNVVPVEEFWQRKVDKLHVLYDYNVISKDEYVEGLVRLGFKLKDVLIAIGEEEDDEE